MENMKKRVLSALLSLAMIASAGAATVATVANQSSAPAAITASAAEINTAVWSQTYGEGSLNSLNLRGWITSKISKIIKWTECNIITGATFESPIKAGGIEYNDSIDLDECGGVSCTLRVYYKNLQGNDYRIDIVSTADKIAFANDLNLGYNKLFAYYTGTEIKGLDKLDTTNLTNMNYMFSSCENLTSLDLSTFNTANVTTMESMFVYCNSLTSLDLSTFNTANLTSTNSMFLQCPKLTSVDLSNFKATVKDVGKMFSACVNLSEIKLNKDFVFATDCNCGSMLYSVASETNSKTLMIKNASESVKSYIENAENKETLKYGDTVITFEIDDGNNNNNSCNWFAVIVKAFGTVCNMLKVVNNAIKNVVVKFIATVIVFL